MLAVISVVFGVCVGFDCGCWVFVLFVYRFAVCLVGLSNAACFGFVVVW